MLLDNIEYSFATDIPESDYQVIVDCPFFRDWIAKARKDFAVTHIHVDSVDYFNRVHRPLFIKITATATLPDGRPVHGVVLLRGNAVGVLVVLRCEGKKYLLLVRQPRLAITEEASLEIPAGILDWSGDYRKVALSELEEEAQIKAEDSELTEEQILRRIALSRHCLQKGGEPDIEKAAAILLDDFRSGRIGKISMERP